MIFNKKVNSLNLNKLKSCYEAKTNDNGDRVTMLEAADWGVIGGYFAIVLGTGLGISLCSKNKGGTATDFLLAGRSLWFLPVSIQFRSLDLFSSLV